MRALLLLGVISIVSGCASAPTTSYSSGFRINKGVFNVPDQKNHMVASIDTATGEVTYYQSPEKGFEAIFLAYNQLTDAIEASKRKSQAPVETLPPQKPEKKK